MDRNEKLNRLRQFLNDIAPDGGIESLGRALAEGAASSYEAMEVTRTDEEVDRAHEGVRKIAQEVPNAQVDDAEISAMEAIILPRERPVVFIQNGKFGALPDPWSHFCTSKIRNRITAAIPAVGRVELPDNPQIPYGGTGFVVGKNLLMTNRHVAELFADGVGLRGLLFRPGQSAALNFRREKGDPEDDRREFVAVRNVVMIHPFWDMALLRVDGLPQGTTPLKLAVRAPEELVGREVAVIGYPARDDRNDLTLQDRIFERIYNVKRLQPGKIRGRDTIRSYGNLVRAATHDSSTLGGNSGSAIIDVLTGDVVGLHFAGVYLKANYAVPTHELASDRRVVDAGLNFTGSVPATVEWDAVWRAAERDQKSLVPVTGTGRVDGQVAVWTVPLQVSVTVSEPMPAQVSAAAGPTGLSVIEAMRIPVIHGNFESREGYLPGFLDLPDEDEVPLPELTEAGRRVAAKLDDGSTELKYHKFSIVMHKKRRLALFTASNVDWRETSRLVNGRKPTRRELTGLGPNDREEWVTDARIPETHQLPDVFFTKDGGAFDKGHLVRRDDVCWGPSFDDIQMSNGDTYHTTNCSPQVAGFNRAIEDEDNWGDLEVLVQKQTQAEKAIIFSGPVLADDDPVFVGRDKRGEVRIQVPRQFWKILVATQDSTPAAYGFTLEQDLSAVPTEFAVPRRWKRYMRRIIDIERMIKGLVKFSGLKRIDQFSTAEGRRIGEGISGT
jgi:endonuclease G